MPGDFLLVELHPEPRLFGKVEVAIFYIRQLGGDVIAPGHAVDVRFHYLDVGHGGANA